MLNFCKIITGNLEIVPSHDKLTVKMVFFGKDLLVPDN